jgi:hypothetical protein
MFISIATLVMGSGVSSGEEMDSAVPLIHGEKGKLDVQLDPNIVKRQKFLELLAGSPGIGYGVDVRDSDRDQYPEAVLILGNGKYCSGVLVTRMAVVTAGHCVCVGASQRVFFGLDRNSPQEYIEVSQARSKSLLDCAEFERTGGVPDGNRDVAVLFLKSSVSFLPRRIANGDEIDAVTNSSMSNLVTVVGR